MVSGFIDTTEEESAIIGAICREPKLIRTVSRILGPEHFSLESSRLVFETAQDLDRDGKAFDALILADSLKSVLPNVRQYLADCIEVTPTTANTEEYAKILRDKSCERQLRERVGVALEEGSGANLADTIAGICSEMIQGRSGSRMERFDKVLERTYYGLFETPENRVDTGYTKVDSLLKGMWGGELIVVAARPGVGKSAWALSVAENAARYQKKTVHLHSLEMENTEIGERALARWSRVLTMNDLIDRFIDTPEKQDDAAKAFVEAARLPIYVDDSPNVRPSKVRAQALTQKDLGLIVVDYGGLMASDRKQESRNLELGAISRDLKNLAKELRIPIIMLAQLNRKVSEEDKPTLQSLRDSGELEQNANKVIFLWSVDQSDGTVGVSVAKNRKGKRGDVLMKFDGEHMSFYELEERYEEPRRRRGGGGFSDDDE